MLWNVHLCNLEIVQDLSNSINMSMRFLHVLIKTTYIKFFLQATSQQLKDVAQHTLTYQFWCIVVTIPHFNIFNSFPISPSNIRWYQCRGMTPISASWMVNEHDVRQATVSFIMATHATFRPWNNYITFLCDCCNELHIQTQAVISHFYLCSDPRIGISQLLKCSDPRIVISFIQLCLDYRTVLTSFHIISLVIVLPRTINLNCVHPFVCA